MAARVRGAQDAGDLDDLLTVEWFVEHSRGIDARALLDDDDVSRFRHFDRRRAQMLRCLRSSIVDTEFDRDHWTGNFALR